MIVPLSLLATSSLCWTRAPGPMGNLADLILREPRHFTRLFAGWALFCQQFVLLNPQVRGRAQNHQNGRKWIQNGRQALRIHPHESYGRSQAFATGPAAPNPPKQARNCRSACSRPPPLSSTAPDRGAPDQTGHRHVLCQKLLLRF